METPSSPTIRRCTAARGAHCGIDKAMATFSKAGRTMFKVMNHVPALRDDSGHCRVPGDGTSRPMPGRNRPTLEA
ncbi:hypothetical protein GCM10010177_54550 [Actinomadura citrea]|nr:hypothetical protein GCM10010177_54550 [Actinomadura citrea]